MHSSPELTVAQLASFREDGYLLVRGLIPEDVRLDALVAIDDLLCTRRPEFRRSSRANVTDEIHGKILALAAADRPALGRLYDAIRKVAPFWRIAGGSELQSTAAALLETRALGLIFRGSGIRLDLPDEDRWRSAWHQEYHSQMSSLRAVTAWFSLVPVSSRMGPVELLRGSHRVGLLPVRCVDPLNARKNYTETFSIPDLDDVVSRFSAVSHATEPGDVLFLDFLTVHQSGFNRDPRCSRVTCQVRYFDMLEEGAVSNDWVGGWQEGGDFRRVHPDKVVP